MLFNHRERFSLISVFISILFSQSPVCPISPPTLSHPSQLRSGVDDSRLLFVYDLRIYMYLYNNCKDPSKHLKNRLHESERYETARADNNNITLTSFEGCGTVHPSIHIYRSTGGEMVIPTVSLAQNYDSQILSPTLYSTVWIFRYSRFKYTLIAPFCFFLNTVSAWPIIIIRRPLGGRRDAGHHPLGLLLLLCPSPIQNLD